MTLRLLFPAPRPALAVLLAASVGLSGCVSIGAKAPASLLALTPEATVPAGQGATGTLAKSVVVMEPAADARVSVLRVPVQIDASNVAYLKKTQWVERPARQFQHLIAETLRAKGGHLVVESDVNQWEQRLSGRLLAMGYDLPSRSAVVRFDAVKEAPGGRIETRRFEARVPNIDDDAQAIGPALNQAANDVARQVVDWLG
ncbi:MULTISPECIES: ABC-type transport auxiliary lipoprotein family protein [unclassified Novosphingobium]|uniref:ABC-type transport auxiliary lipoprotein family protein n=1 Tax=unclassified Novosphingobium TaxID=2644732 RepID=UPI0014483145|nr:MULTISPECIES: ABC-type transport auxiliary lipoprotein family protein [unclassified Novosphingobium]NKJ41071.1 cholesterol transport system auxiliary component [Novosphingobium sp. SG720]NMN03318.1 cholesterol transport system auxiliary component [Novosphingobium sp. SG919]NMN86692.1 cholesterol transport system auxiliary component [Novosphingobium sp. SG916]